MTSITTRQLSKLIGLIHDAALTPALWPDALDGIRRALAGSAALLLTPLHGPQAGGLAIPNNISAETMARYTETFHRLDLWTQAGESRQLFTPGTVATDEALVPREHLLASPYYREFLAPANISRLCTSVIFGQSDPENLPTVISIYRGIDAEPFGCMEKNRLRLLTPHLSRALGLMFRLRNAENKLAASLAALDKLSCGIILFGRDGCVVHTNSAAAELLKGNDSFCLAESVDGRHRLSTSSQTGTKRLDRFIESAVSTSAEAFIPVPQSMRVPGKSGGSPRVLSISPLPHDHGFVSRAGHAVAIGFLFDTMLPPQGDAQLLGEIYGLTPAEIRLASELCAGLSIASIAIFHRVSTETLKSQLKSIFSKTGTHRQIDVVRIASILAIKK